MDLTLEKISPQRLLPLFFFSVFIIERYCSHTAFNQLKSKEFDRGFFFLWRGKILHGNKRLREWQGFLSSEREMSALSFRGDPPCVSSARKYFRLSLLSLGPRPVKPLRCILGDGSFSRHDRLLVEAELRF